MRFQFTYQRGGSLIVTTLAEAPLTTAAVKSEAPFDATVYQARWSGREIFVPVKFKNKPVRENQSIRANIGDVIYFHEWPEQFNYTGFEAIGMFYGPEIVREWRGDCPVNVFGRVDPSQFDLLKEIGERVWRQGGEAISITPLDS